MLWNIDTISWNEISRCFSVTIFSYKNICLYFKFFKFLHKYVLKYTFTRTKVFNKDFAAPRGCAEVLQMTCKSFGYLDQFFFFFPFKLKHLQNPLKQASHIVVNWVGRWSHHAPSFHQFEGCWRFSMSMDSVFFSPHRSCCSPGGRSSSGVVLCLLLYIFLQWRSSIWPQVWANVCLSVNTAESWPSNEARSWSVWGGGGRGGRAGRS